MTQEVRFAVAMSGGVSLAVWMGGVAREMNLLQQASNLRLYEDSTGRPRGSGGDGSADAQCRDLYLRLLRLLDVKVTVDVLSGTSAGGINAALLGLSSAAGIDLAGLRDLWLTTGSMDTLLRDPREKAPPSLMQGDKVLFNGLAQGIHTLYGNGRGEPGLAPPDSAVDTTVFITTTMMSGETSRFTDDYGTLVPDVDHHGLLTFGKDDLAPEEDMSSLTALALAARSSASFPGAFEPSFVPVNTHIDAAKGIPGRPDMARYANMTRSHWVADGGLLANRPLNPLLAQVFAQPARGEVRRVLAFVVPDGGGTARPAAQPGADHWERPPTLAGALKEDLDAQLAQSITSDLQAIRTHNERITAGHNRRRYLAEMGARPPAPGSLVTEVLLGDYQRQQGAGLAQPLLDEMMRQLTTMAMPGEWAAELSVSADPAEKRMARGMAAILGGGWQAGPPSGAWTAWTAADPFDRAAAFGLPVFHAAQAVAVHLLKLGYQRATEASERELITHYRAEIEDACPLSSPDWHERHEVGAKLAAAAGASPVPDLRAVAVELAEAKRRALLIGPGTPATAGEPRAAWVKLADATVLLLAHLNGLAVPDGRSSRQEAADAIGSYLRYFGPTPTSAELADRLLSLVIAERALEPTEPEVHQPVEFIQVSANTRTLLAPKGELDTVSKLRGVELFHFAAFYKSSWRAYDWMWGRLDGSGWLVHILLDPRRILAVIEDHYRWPHGMRAREFANLLRETAGLPTGLKGDCLQEDLAFLDQPDAPIPMSLPGSALFLAQAWQNLIAASELPTIALQLLAEPTSQAPDVWATNVRIMKDTNREPAEFAKQLPSCPVREETFAGQVRTPAFARLATKAIAVATAAITAAPETPSVLRPALTTARNVTRTGYMAAKATGGSGWKTLAAGVVLAVVGGVLATQGMIVVGLTGTVVALVGLYLIALGAWGIHRGLLGALLAFTALAALGSLTLAWVRNQLWGTGRNNTGLVARTALPWLRSTWWGGLVVIGGILLLAGLISALTRRNPRRQRPAQIPGAARPPSDTGGGRRHPRPPMQQSPVGQPSRPAPWMNDDLAKGKTGGKTS
jgi:patatin-related protein